MPENDFTNEELGQLLDNWKKLIYHWYTIRGAGQSLAANIQEERSCKKFEVTYIYQKSI